VLIFEPHIDFARNGVVNRKLAISHFEDVRREGLLERNWLTRQHPHGHHLLEILLVTGLDVGNRSSFAGSEFG